MKNITSPIAEAELAFEKKTLSMKQNMIVVTP